MSRWILIFFLVLGLCWWSYERTDGFSLHKIEAPQLIAFSPPLSPENRDALSQPYYYLGKGRQCFVFASEDGKTVLKFFNKNYLMEPWYTQILPKKWKADQIAKRAERRDYYFHSYAIAKELFDEEILHLHLGESSEALPTIPVIDKASRLLYVDLNQTPFVLQKKGTPFYEALNNAFVKDGLPGLENLIDQFIATIAHQIEKQIADADHDVEHNWGVVDGKIFHLDPGRLYVDDQLSHTERVQKEWWSTTHRFRRWLLNHYPETVPYLDANIERTMQRQAQQPAPVSPLLQTGE